jgi:glycosyltransferase involved in cell wall biosynthesis
MTAPTHSVGFQEMANPPPSHRVRKSKSICVVTEDFIDWGPRLEVGASMSAIAEALVSEGNEVTLLWVPDTQLVDEDEIRKIKDYYYDNFLITVEVLTNSKGLLPNQNYPARKSASVYYYLKENSFSAVYFALEGGLSYYTMIGKETDLFAPRPALVVVAHSPVQWLSEADRFFLGHREHISVAHMEKFSVGLADRLICVSKGIRNWMVSHGWKLPNRVDVLPTLFPSQWRLHANTQFKRTISGHCEEIALLAGPDFRDGLTLFCDALDELAKADIARLKVTAFGPFGQILGEHTGGMLLRRARRWPFDVHIIPRLRYREILEFLSANRALAVIPSLASATGHWAAACLDSGIPFIATAVGANEELLSPNPDAPQLARAEPKHLASKIAAALESPLLASSVLKPEARRIAWLDAAGAIDVASQPKKPSRKSAGEEPLVSIVLVHHDRPQYVVQAIASIERQSYRNFEVILVDDGSELPESTALLDRLEPKFRTSNWKILRQENKYLGAARNAGIRESRGEFILIMDDDNALFRDGLRKFVHAILSSGSDICTAFHKVFTGESVPRSEEHGMVHYLPVGAVLDLGLIGNPFGDANAIIRRSAFDKIGLQIENYGYTAQDWEFYSRAILSGLKLQVIPEPLYWYRSSTQAMYRSSHWYDNRLPILAAFKKHDFQGLEFLYHLALAAFAPESEVNSLRENLRRSSSDSRYLRLCELNPNSTAAIELLAEIAAAEGRPDAALVLLGRAQVSQFRPAVVDRLSAEPFIDNAVRELAAGLTTERRFTHRDLMRLEASTTSPLGGAPLFYVEQPDKCFLQSTSGNTSLAVLPAGCPSSTASAFLTASLDQELAAPAEMLLMLAPFHLDPAIAVQSAKHAPAEGSSGWCSVSLPFTPRKLEAVLSAPSDRPLNLILAIKPKDGLHKAVLGCFSALGLKISLGKRASHRPRLGPPPTKHRARALVREEVGKARLVSRFPSELPLLLLDPGDGGIFLRPTKHGPTVALIEYGFPSLARGLIGQVEIAHDAAAPFEFALALMPTSSTIEWTGEKPRNSQAFSGWVRVEDTFKLHDVAVTLRDLTATALHIAFAIRLPPGSSASPASSFWRKFVPVWDE